MSVFKSISERKEEREKLLCAAIGNKIILQAQEKMPQDFHCGKKAIEFSDVTGTVLTTKTTAIPHIWSSGGGGVLREGNYIAPPTIHSSVITAHEFWIQQDNGVQVPIRLSGANIPLAEGQRVSVICAKLVPQYQTDIVMNVDGVHVKGAWPLCKVPEDKERYAILVNYNAWRHWFIKDAKTLVKEFKLCPYNWMSLFIVVAIVGVIAWFTGARWKTFGTPADTANWELACGIAGFFLVCTWIKQWFKFSKTVKSLEKYLEDVGQWTYKHLHSS